MTEVRVRFAGRGGRIGIWLMALALVALAAAPAKTPVISPLPGA